MSEHLFARRTTTTARLTDDAAAMGNDLDPVLCTVGPATAHRRPHAIQLRRRSPVGAPGRGAGGPFYGAQPLQPAQTCAPTGERLPNRSPAEARCAWKNVVFPAPFGPAIATRIGRRSNSANSIRGMGPPGIPDRRIARWFACHRHRRGSPAPASRQLADSGETAATRGIPRHADVPQPNQPRPDTPTAGLPLRPAVGRVLGSLRAMVRSLGRVAPRTRSDQQSSAPRSLRSVGHRG